MTVEPPQKTSHYLLSIVMNKIPQLTGLETISISQISHLSCISAKIGRNKNEEKKKRGKNKAQKERERERTILTLNSNEWPSQTQLCGWIGSMNCTGVVEM